MVHLFAIDSIMSGNWAGGGKKLLPALKRVHLHPDSMQAGLTTKETLSDVFGQRDLKLVADDRAVVLIHTAFGFHIR